MNHALHKDVIGETAICRIAMDCQRYLSTAVAVLAICFTMSAQWRSALRDLGHTEQPGTTEEE